MIGEKNTDMSSNTFDYSIYNIVCKNTDVSHNYVGSTRAWCMRKLCHKQRTNGTNPKYSDLPLYVFIRKFGGWDNWQMILLEEVHCSKREAEAIERKWIEKKKADLNSCKRPYITEEERMIQKKYSDSEYQKKNAEKIAKNKKEYREKNAENIKLYKKQYYQENKDAVKAKANTYYENNKERVLERTKEYSANNKDKIAKYNREWREKNKEKCKEYREQRKEKYQEYQRDYNKAYKEKNRERLHKKFDCECGGSYILKNKSTHFKTKKHVSYIESLE